MSPTKAASTGLTSACANIAPPAATGVIIVDPIVASTRDIDAKLSWTATSSTNLGYFDIVLDGKPVARLAPTERSFNLTGMECGKDHTVVVKGVHPDGLRTSSSTSVKRLKTYCNASLIFQKTDTEYFWFPGGGWGGTTPTYPNGTSLEITLEMGGGIGLYRWSDDSRNLPLIHAGSAVQTTPPTLLREAKVMFDVSLKNMTSGSPVTSVDLVPAVNFGKQGVLGSTRLSATPTNVPFGSTRTVTVRLGTLAGAAATYDYLDRIDITLNN